MRLSVVLIDADPAAAEQVRGAVVHALPDAPEFVIHPFSSIAAASDFLKHEKAAVILLNPELPDINRQHVVAAVRTITQLPIVVCCSQFTDAKAFLRQGAEDFLLEQHIGDGQLPKTLFLAAERTKYRESSWGRDDRYHQLIDKAPYAIAVHVAGELVFVNEACARLLKVKQPEELIGRSVMEFVHPDYKALIAERMKQIAVSGKDAPPMEHRLITPDGQLMDVEISGSPVNFRGQQAIQIIIQDISDRKKHENSRLMSETSYRELFNHSSDLIYIQDQSGIFLDINQTVVDTYGYSREELIGQSPAILSAHGKNDLEMIGKALAKAWQGQPQGFDFWAITKKGKVFLKAVIVRRGKYFGEDVLIASGRDMSERLEVSRALARSERNYRELFDSSSEFLYVLNKQGVFLEVNRAVLSAFGLKKKMILGKSFTDFTPVSLNDLHSIEDKILTAWDGESQSFECWFQLGSETYVQDVVLKKGNFIGKEALIASGRDISERIRIENRLRESEEVHRLTVLASNDGFWDWNLTTSEIYYSPRWKAIFGYQPDELFDNTETGKQIFVPEERQRVNQMLDDYREGKLSEFRTITRGVHKSGSEVYVLMRVTRILDADGSVSRMIGVLSDITESKLAEERLMENRNLIQGIAEAIPDSVYLYDLEQHEFIYTNRSIPKSLGYSDTQIAAMKGGIFTPLTHPEDLDNKLACLSYLKMNPGNPYEIDFRLRHANGSYRWFSSRDQVYSVNNTGEVTHILGITRDITNMKLVQERIREAKERAEQAARAKQDFLSNMSHEIRTPMNAVIGYTNLLLQSDPNAEQLSHLKVLKFSAENLLELIDDILDYTKIESGKVELKEAPFVLIEVMQNLYKTFKAGFMSKKVEWSTQIDPSIPPTLIGDSVRLSQILYNLVGNALKFTPDGSVRLQASLKEVRDELALVEFVVSDTGIGIPSDKLEYIFERFSQIRDRKVQNASGSGLGLAIIHGLLDLQNSQMEVESELGKGSLFRFALHFPIGEAETTDSPLENQNQPDPLLSRVRLLFVEDNEVNRMVAGKFLSKWSVQTDFAENGAIALEMMKDNEYHLILMDLQMPVMDGFDATREIRKLSDPTKKNIPIIALSADVMEETKALAKEAGLNDYVTKPFSPQNLREVIMRYAGEVLNP